MIEQVAVLADAKQVIDVVPIAPAQQSGTIEVIATLKADAGVGPVLAD